LRDFVSVHDVVQANLAVMCNDAADYQALNVGSGQPLSYADISKIQRLLGYEPKVTLETGIQELITWSETAEAVDQVETATEELRIRGLIG
jgi:dTDP-L-rhamnose 4-epimerase